MAAQPNDPDVERLVLENNLLSADELSQFKARAAAAPGQGLYGALVNEGVIPYDMQVQLESQMQTQAAPQPNPLTGTAGGTLRRRLAQGFEQPGGAGAAPSAPMVPPPALGVPPPRLGAVPPPKLGGPPPALGVQAPPVASALLGKPPALAGLGAPPAAARPAPAVPVPMVPPPLGLKAPGPAAPLIPPPKVGGGIPPPKLPGGPLIPAPRIALTPPAGSKPTASLVPAAAPAPAAAAPATHAPAHAPAAPPPAAHAQEAPPPKEHGDHGGHGHGAPAGEPKIPEGWPGGIAPIDNSPNGIQAMLKKARGMGASDLHLTVGLAPMVRIHGDLHLLEPGIPAMTPEEIQRLLRVALAPAQWAYFDRTGDLDFSYAFGGGRYRANAMRERNGDGFACRIIGDRIFTPEHLGLPAHARRLTEFAQGLVLVTGPSGHGKTTTMMTLVELVNANRPDHIITVEEPIEYIMEGKKCHVSQREVGPHTMSFANALRAALRENPDIIVICELRDYETTSMAINAAETGHLVFASLPTQDAAKTIDKVLDYFPPEEQTQIRLMVSESLRGILSQQLIKKKDGTGRVAAVELLFNSVAVANIIRDANTAGLINAMQLGKNAGMVLMDDSLMDLVNKGVINGEDAYLRSTNKVKFKQWEPKVEAAAKPAASAPAAAPGARPGLPGRR
ncbi:MAG: PilT/PilU family type 4a pilus ATPase [Planctomycetes bacterium]|nr:PilT/PilU family type 4a pilus ATPase [Planctomycetota bacterium]